MLMRGVNWLGSARRQLSNWYRRQILGRFFGEATKGRLSPRHTEAAGLEEGSWHPRPRASSERTHAHAKQISALWFTNGYYSSDDNDDAFNVGDVRYRPRLRVHAISTNAARASSTFAARTPTATPRFRVWYRTGTVDVHQAPHATAHAALPPRQHPDLAASKITTSRYGKTH